MSLRERLKAEIAENGPMTVEAFMTRCLYDPKDGYYATRPRLGAEGDFITAPHVSQMFGELIGLWAAELWIQMGSPARVRLVELGPGDGTLMADILRVGRAAPGFVEAAEVWLVETSGPLRARQAAALAPHEPRWVERIEDVPTDAPVIVIGNEFLDCAPIRQFVRVGERWMERTVGLKDGELAFGLTPCPLVHITADDPPGSILVLSAALGEVAEAIGRLVAHAGGAALMIDYGSENERSGDTLQALRGHVREGPLEHPGEADLTVRVDFGWFLAYGARHGAVAAPLVTQGEFLRRLGIEQRAEVLKRANPARAEVIERQLQRLIGTGQMGELFKAACLHSKGLRPPGFEP
ncbi:MAG TPA: SAM-dependent methyltransferase [Caulobacteraceae bacterium]|nr:SAM-dependent methyltransferase [Caulobacteraceae bacterium]